MSSQLFATDYVADETYLQDKKASYCIDTSGSTSGAVLQLEVLSAEQLMGFIPCQKVVSWSTTAEETTLENLRAGRGLNGGTSPMSMMVHIQDTEFLIIHTDGQIHGNEMTNFKQRVTEQFKDIPVIVVLTVSPSYTQTNTIQDIERCVNMSIPNAFLTMANNVCIVINVNGDHRVLMRSGCFTFPVPELTNQMPLSQLPVFDMTKLPKKYLSGLPKNMVMLDGYSDPLVLDRLYDAEEIADDVLEQLNNRVILAKLDKSRMTQTLTRLKQKLSENPTLAGLRGKIANLVGMGQVGSPEHKELIQEYKNLKATENTKENARTLHFVNRLLSAILENQSESMSFVLGSQRANSAAVVKDDDLSLVEDCVTAECPILLQEDDAGILLKEPKTPNYLMEFTNDFAINSPFALGRKMAPCITPGIYGKDFIQSITTNPFTREPVLGYLPLTRDPQTLMRHLGKLFGKREMWHLVPAYMSMISEAANQEWLQKDVLVEQLRGLADNLKVDGDLNHSPQGESFRKIAQDLVSHPMNLKNRTRDDIYAFLATVDLIMPDFEYPRDKVLSMASFLETAETMWRKHRAKEDMKPYLMNVDELGHYESSIESPEALVAHIFWHDRNGRYRNCRFHQVINWASSDQTYGKAFKNALEGNPIDSETFRVAYPEPSGVHFDNRLFFELGFTGLPDHKCIYCGEMFGDNDHKIRHIKATMGKYFYNGTRALLSTVNRLGIHTETKTLFRETKRYLENQYGETAGFLHTQDCKNVILNGIQRLKEEAQKDPSHAPKGRQSQLAHAGAAAQTATSVKYLNGDLVDFADDGTFDLILFGCNCMHHWAGGLTQKIKFKYPMAYQADLKTPNGDKSKLGTISHSTSGDLTIVNAYIQHHWNEKVGYDTIRSCLREVKKQFPGKRIGMPKIGTGLAGGSWYHILPIIQEELKDEDVTVVIYE